MNGSHLTLTLELIPSTQPYFVTYLVMSNTQMILSYAYSPYSWASVMPTRKFQVHIVKLRGLSSNTAYTTDSESTEEYS